MSTLTENVPTEIKDAIFDLAPRLGWCVNNHECIALCSETECEDCKFSPENTSEINGLTCADRRIAWLKSHCIDWTKVSVDTKILVRNKFHDPEWEPKHFAGMYTNNKGVSYPCYYATGVTSWTAGDAARIPVTNPNYIKLGLVEEVERYGFK